MKNYTMWELHLPIKDKICVHKICESAYIGCWYKFIIIFLLGFSAKEKLLIVKNCNQEM